MRGAGIDLSVRVRRVNCDVQRRVEGAKGYGVFGIILIKRSVHLAIG